MKLDKELSSENDRQSNTKDIQDRSLSSHKQHYWGEKTSGTRVKGLTNLSLSLILLLGY